MPAEKLKLTEAGAAALKAWADRRGVTLADLGDAAGTHIMFARRLLRREGLATLEQLGRIVAYCGGELTAAQLVGLELAASVPTFPVRVLPPASPGSAPAPAAGAIAPGAPPPGAPPAGEEVAQAPAGSSRKTLEWLRDHARSETLRADCAQKLLKLDEAEEGEEEKDARPVREVDLIEKFETLLYNCRRQWAAANGLAIDVPAPAAELPQVAPPCAPAAVSPGEPGASCAPAGGGLDPAPEASTSPVEPAPCPAEECGTDACPAGGGTASDPDVVPCTGGER